MHTFPIGIAAGMIKEAKHIDRALLPLLDHITLGSYTLKELPGNDEPTTYFDPETGMMLNAIGLKNVGVQKFLTEELDRLSETFNNAQARFRVSFAPTGPGTLKRMFWQARVHSLHHLIDEAEINAACPNHRTGTNHHPVLAHDPTAVQELLKETAGYLGHKALKIAPRTDPETLRIIVQLCERYGVGTIVSGNTLLTEAKVNGKYVLSVAKGGQSGAPLFKDALQQVATLREIVSSQRAPIKIHACGGVLDAQSAVSMFESGADVVDVATLYWNYGPKAVAHLVRDVNLLSE